MLGRELQCDRVQCHVGRHHSVISPAGYSGFWRRNCVLIGYTGNFRQITVTLMAEAAFLLVTQ